MTLAARVRVVCGLIIEGSVRDPNAVRGLHFSVFAMGVCIKGTTQEILGTINSRSAGFPSTPGRRFWEMRMGLWLWRPRTCLASSKNVAKEKFREELKKGKSTLEIYGFDRILQAKGLKES